MISNFISISIFAGVTDASTGPLGNLVIRRCGAPEFSRRCLFEEGQRSTALNQYPPVVFKIYVSREDRTC